MPRYYFHADDRIGEIRDDTGVELENASDAKDYALRSARSIMADDMRRGILDLDGTIEVVSSLGEPICTIHYRDAVQSSALQQPVGPMRPAAPSVTPWIRGQRRAAQASKNA